MVVTEGCAFAHLDPAYRRFAALPDEERIAWTEKFFRSAFARPEFVGWHYCGLIDASQLVARKQDRQHSGLMDGFGKAYPGLDTMIKQCSSELYSIATNGV